MTNHKALVSIGAVAASLLFAVPALAQAAAPAAVPEGEIVVTATRNETMASKTPVALLDSWITPTDAFFVRQHLPRPAKIDGAAWRLTVGGMVSKPLQLSLAHCP